MLNTISTQAKFFISAIAFVLIGFLLVLFLPIILTETLYFNRENIILLTPASNLTHFTYALLLILLAIILLGFKRNFVTYAVAALLIVGGVTYSTYAVLGYTAIQKEQIILKNFNTEMVYPWADIVEVTYEYSGEPNGIYTFKTANNEEFQIFETGKFGTEVKKDIYLTAIGHEVAFIEKARE